MEPELTRRCQNNPEFTNGATMMIKKIEGATPTMLLARDQENCFGKKEKKKEKLWFLMHRQILQQCVVPSLTSKLRAQASRSSNLGEQELKPGSNLRI